MAVDAMMELIVNLSDCGTVDVRRLRGKTQVESQAKRPAWSSKKINMR
jgi:hypothetical protein